MSGQDYRQAGPESAGTTLQHLLQLYLTMNEALLLDHQSPPLSPGPLVGNIVKQYNLAVDLHLAAQCSTRNPQGLKWW